MQQRFLLQILLLAQHVSGTTIPIIRGSRVLYSGCCLWYFVLRFSSCSSGVELRIMCPLCRMLVSTLTVVFYLRKIQTLCRAVCDIRNLTDNISLQCPFNPVNLVSCAFH